MSREEQRSARARGPRRRVSFIGVFGEVLITAGVMVLLFIAWQNVFNSWYLNGKQDSAAAQLGKQWLEQSEGSGTSSGSGGGAQTAVGPNAAIPVEKTAPAYLGAVGVIYVPRFGTDWKRTIREGTDTPVLNSTSAGVGHYQNTAMPGAVGNFAVAAHDTGYGNTFLHIQNLRVGDKVYVQTQDGFYTYVFRNYVYVQPNAVQALQPVPMKNGQKASDRILTMTTCNPPYHSVERLVAYSVLESFSKTPPAAIAGAVG
ncbi:class E sortase [Gryllotalpicola reticulitermitis]|uniref:Class E sortase n=1 Tax=Gryllotalpicola reticulitermitis TaxID=1184153 RepID=A0ABV8Q899_9MICO